MRKLLRNPHKVLPFLVVATSVTMAVAVITRMRVFLIFLPAILFVLTIYLVAAALVAFGWLLEDEDEQSEKESPDGDSAAG